MQKFKRQNHKITNIQKNKNTQKRNNPRIDKIQKWLWQGCAFFPIERGPAAGGELEGRHRNSRQMQPDALDDDDDDDDDDGVDLNIVIGVKDGITDRINMWQWCWLW